MGLAHRILPTLVVLAPAHAASLDDVLARMDAAAKQFKSYSATAKVTKYTKKLDDTDVSNGAFRLRRIKNGVGGIMDLTAGSDRQVFHFNGPEFEIYLPKAGEKQVYKIGHYTGMVNRMLLVGFSVTRDDLRRDYGIALGSVEKLGAIPATRIVLTPKSREALKNIAAIDLWIPDGAGYAIKQKITHPNGNYELTEYSNLQLNPPRPDSEYELNTPPGTKRVVMN